MSALLLLVGIATDGPSNIPVAVTSSSELNRMFGGNYTQRQLLAPTATSIVLDYDPVALPGNEVDGVKNYLYSPSIVGNNTFAFGSLGGISYSQLDALYTPYLGTDDVLFASRRFEVSEARQIYMARIGCSRATHTEGTWTFSARFDGIKYNKVYLTSTGSSITIWGLEPNYPTFYYETTAPEEMVEQIERAYLTGTCPVFVDSWTGSLPVFESALSGGSDGTVNETSLAKFLDYITMPADVTHIVVLSSLTSGMVRSVSTYNNGLGEPPRQFLFEAPAYTDPASGWASSMLTELPERLDSISAFVGSCTVILDGSNKTRHFVEAAALAYLSGGGVNLTNLAVSAQSFTPVLTENELLLLTQRGFTCPVRRIGAGIAVFRGATLSNGSFLYEAKKSELYSAAWMTALDYIGLASVQGTRPDIVKAIEKGIASVSFVEIESVKAVVQRDVLRVEIVARLFKEILNISFSIRNR